MPSPSSPSPQLLPRLLLAVVRPFRAYFETEAASGVVLLLATLVALGWANSPFHASLDHLLETPFELRFGSHSLSWPLQHWINEVLMSVFFWVAGMEIKRELAVGELRTFRAAALPLIAALGGMIVPALIYAALNHGQPTSRGWGIPMATDIAFALGALSLLGPRVPSSLYVFLAALAIFDDLGAIAVIALFYGGKIAIGPLILSIALCLVAALMARLKVMLLTPYIALGVVLWIALLFAGLHPTLAGVAIGLAIPASAPRQPEQVLDDVRAAIEELSEAAKKDGNLEGAVAAIERHLESMQAPLDRFQRGLHRPVAFVILPLFATANAGVQIDLASLESSSSQCMLGVILGLTLGKPIGVTLATWLAIKLGFAPMPSQSRWPQLVGIGALAGIGFTMSTFVTSIAFPNEASLQNAAKLGILFASTLSLLLGVGCLLASSRNPSVSAVEPDGRLGLHSAQRT